VKKTIYPRKCNKDNFDVQPPIVAFPIRFLRDLSKAIVQLKPQRAIIFGSAIREGLNARDIDLLILADFFSHVLWQDRHKLFDLPRGPIYDLRLFTPLEFETFYPPTSPLRRRIEKEYIDLEEYYYV